MLYLLDMAVSKSSGPTVPTCDVVAIDEVRIRKVAKKALGDLAAKRLASTFKMLGNPTRVRILDALSHAELCVCDLSVLLQMRISTISHQLALLKQHNIVRSRRDGKMIYYALDDRHVQTLFRQSLAHLKHSQNDEPNGRPRSTTGQRA